MKKYNKNFEGLNFSTGNKKLVPNKDVKFLIWNLPAVTTCPFRTATCEKLCYARKAERVYPQVLPSREENYMDTERFNFVELAIETIQYFRKRWKGAKEIIVRIHESGDFYSRGYLKAWYDIAWQFASLQCQPSDGLPTVRFTAYTKSVDFIEHMKEQGHIYPPNMVIRASIWHDTTDYNIRCGNRLGLPIYTAFEKNNIPDGFHKCDCVDCGTCLKCYTYEHKNIACEIH